MAGLIDSAVDKVKNALGFGDSSSPTKLTPEELKAKKHKTIVNSDRDQQRKKYQQKKKIETAEKAKEEGGYYIKRGSLYDEAVANGNSDIAEIGDQGEIRHNTGMGPSIPTEFKDAHESKKGNHVFTDFIVYDGVKYSYTFKGPTLKEIQDLARAYRSEYEAKVRKVDERAPIPPNHVFEARAEQTLFEDRHREMVLKIRAAAEQYETLRNDVKREPGISQRGVVKSLGTGDRDVKFEDVVKSQGGPTLKVHSRAPSPNASALASVFSGFERDRSLYPLNSVDSTTDENTIKSELDSLIERVNAGTLSPKHLPKDGNFQPCRDTVLLPIEKPSSKKFGEAAHELAIRFGGGGDINLQMQEELREFNRFNKTFIPTPRELKGYTFFSRPHLNLSSKNLVHLREFYPLLYSSDTSIGMYIRQMLDTEYSYNAGGTGGVHDCPFINTRCAFNVLLSNALKSIQGFPDPDLTTEATAGGFFSEQQTNVIGFNRLSKGQDLTLEFRDYPGGPVLAMHDYWCKYMGNIADGSMVQYTDDIENNLMGYTVSIYRFITDHTGRVITRWAKCTGCFPKMQPIGAVYNVSEAEKVITANKTFTVPYFCHHFGYNDPVIIKEFNELSARYCPGVRTLIDDILDGNVTTDEGSRGRILEPTLTNSHSGIPYIIQPKIKQSNGEFTQGDTFELVFYND